MTECSRHVWLPQAYADDDTKMPASSIPSYTWEELLQLEREEQEALCCPISFAPMTEAVVAEDGYTYQRESIAAWMRKCSEGEGRDDHCWLCLVILLLLLLLLASR